jgi:hypothetical protein
MGDYNDGYKMRMATAKAEARRFLRRLEMLEHAMKDRDDNETPPALNAAMKRASLDLSQALSALRKGVYRPDLDEADEIQYWGSTNDE